MLASSFPHETLMHVVKQLPAAPKILAQLGRMLLELDNDLSDVTALLRCDTALTARIIRISNSAAYNIGSPYGTLEQALSRVGYSEVYRITGLAAVTPIMDQNLALYGATGAQMRENSLFCALAMEALAEPAGINPSAAYTAGLLRSIGKIALDRLTRDPAYVGRYSPGSSGPLAKWERDFTGISNCEAAALILGEWRFPPAAIGGVSYHYVPGVSSNALAQLLNLAAGAAERTGHGLPGENSYWERRDERLAGAKLEAEQFESAVERTLVNFERLRMAIG